MPQHIWIKRQLGATVADVAASYRCNECDYVVILSPNQQFLSPGGFWVDAYHLVYKPSDDVSTDPNKWLREQAPLYLTCEGVLIGRILEM